MQIHYRQKKYCYSLRVAVLNDLLIASKFTNVAPLQSVRSTKIANL